MKNKMGRIKEKKCGSPWLVPQRGVAGEALEAI
jgi:hypothetical protein